MNEATIKGQWKQLGGKFKARWGRLADDDLRDVEGDANYLADKIQERYGLARKEARRQVNTFNPDRNRPRPN